MDALFQALAHGERRKILDILKQQPGARVADVDLYFGISRIAVMKHIGVLEAAGLVISEKVGRERRLYFNAVPIQMIHDRWRTEYGELWAGALTRLKYKVEGSKGR